MSIFSSKREKKLWIWAFIVFIAIYATLFIGKPLATLFNNQDVQAIVFLLVMILIGVTIISHSLKYKPSNIELTLLLGIIAVYIMFFLRLGLPERSHLMEYSVLTIFIHKALIERFKHKNNTLKPALFAFIISVVIGVTDECIQIFLPNRVFDFNDILFNIIAVIGVLFSNLFLNWVRKKKSKAY